ncbi:erythromycin esterase family protein [Winogradskyella sp. HB-48]|uniref:erythromycin esterase family protein n=1 Tax=Winogradskyella sp. HB-48 TaxID=3416808 RepID=UPI003CFA4EB4
MKNYMLFVFFGLTARLCFAQCHTELKNYTTGFESIQASSFSFLDEALNDIRIVGYGEDTHGTGEFTILAKELMQYLLEQHDFKILIIETGFGEGLYLNDYIQGKRDDLEFILKEINSTWRYRTKEFIGLMNWLRDYNENNKDKIFLYGCEMQYVRSEISRIKDYLKSVESDYKIEGFEKNNLWEQFNDDEKTDYFIAYTKLKKYFIENSEAFKNKTSEEEFNIAYHLVEILGQFVTTINQNHGQRKADFRDIYMGENILWIMNHYNHNKKAMYWAHNAHVGDWVDNGIVDVTGHQLRKLYGEYYFNIATDFGTGNFIAYPNDANKTGNWRFKTFTVDKVIEDTFTNCLKSFGKPNTFLNVRAARTNENLAFYLNSGLTSMSGAGARARSNETETKLFGRAFDAVIYLDKTNAITWAE